MTNADTAGDPDAVAALEQRVLDARAAVAATRPAECTTRPPSMVPDGDPVEIKNLGGQSAGAKLLTYADGTKLVYKNAAALGEGANTTDPVAATDAEELGAAVLAALGLPCAAVERTGETELHIEYIQGYTGNTFIDADKVVDPDFLDRNQGRLLGLADHVMANHDRHGGNWMWTQDENVIGIDHGGAFHDDRPVSGSVFAHALYEQVDDEGYEWKLAPCNDFTTADTTEARHRLDELRPEFERTGRGDWHTAMMRRLGEVEQAAAGTRNRLAPKAQGDVTTPDNASSWPTADHDSPGGWPGTDQDATADSWPDPASDTERPKSNTQSRKDTPMATNNPTPEQPADAAPKSAAEQIMDAFAQANERKRQRESAPRTSTEDPSTGNPPPRKQSQVNRQDWPGISNVNYAEPGATVGIQAAVVNGATVVMNGNTVSTTGLREAGDAGLDEKTRRTIERAKAAAANARAQVAAGKATTHYADGDSITTTDENGNTTVTNVASGNDRVAFQVGIQFGTPRR
ncbi:hypothetical protein [Amycolatopsis sp. H20-H5]|uniref:hypothetical protein n=1 Tax=Amycolatopsis sp. H20-H5 TaxID=3046309 RepID=UPI002DB82F14|nr:hypothetical protein [Amycolatopsis sp. H20-H5]MEC3974600.1 hypothetical protein [Amycolatopsis sp. H20-H5]